MGERREGKGERSGYEGGGEREVYRFLRIPSEKS